MPAAWASAMISASSWYCVVFSARRCSSGCGSFSAEKTTQYQLLAEIMADAQTAGMVKIGFVTNPKDKAAAGP